MNVSKSQQKPRNVFWGEDEQNEEIEELMSCDLMSQNTIDGQNSENGVYSQDF
jgi:hypothetical protein